MKFFKDKLVYLQKRHRRLRREMRRRGFTTNYRISIGALPRDLHNDWKPTHAAMKLVKARIIKRLREKPSFYRYEGEVLDVECLVAKIERSREAQLFTNCKYTTVVGKNPIR